MLGFGSLVLCGNTIRGTTFEDKARIASAAGYAGVSVTPDEVAVAAERAGSVSALRRMVEDLGIDIADLDALSGWLGGDTTSAPSGNRWSAQAMIDLAAGVGARAINLIDVSPERRTPSYLVERFARLCELAEPAGVIMYMECARGSALKDLKTAGTIVQEAGYANGGVLLDTWHYQRGRSGEENQVAEWAGVVRMVQMSDAAAAPVGAYMDETLHGRLLPGMGVIDLSHIIGELAKADIDCPIGLEVLSDDLDRFPPLTAARLAAVAGQGILDAIGEAK